jgi:DNA polymerase elongation subunit (family B)
MSLQFQSIDWNSKDIGTIYNLSHFQDDEGNKYENLHLTLDVPKYNIKIYGKTEEEKNVAINAIDYTPYFYLKIPKKLTDSELASFKKYINDIIPLKLKVYRDKDDEYYYTKNSLENIVQLTKKDLWGFTNNKSFDFLRLTFYNELTMKYISRMFKKSVNIPSIYRRNIKLGLYENNIEPFLRFIHKQNILPSGWIEIQKTDLIENKTFLVAKKGLNYNVNWKKIKGIEKKEIAPFLVASFDIETNSSHGDFPIAQKDYEKVALDLNTLFQKNIAKSEVVLKDILVEAILSGFDDSIETEYKISKIYTKKEPNLEKMRMILENGFIDDLYIILKGKLQFDTDMIPDLNKYLMRKASIGEELNGDEDEDEIQKFKNIFKSGKDIQNSTTIIIKQLIDKFTKFSAIFPAIEGDNVIQIGTTYHKYGEKDICLKHIITLKSCDEIEDATVVSVETEKELILEWVKLINKTNPDIITGYNIFGFDFKFLYERALELNIKNKFLKLGRIKNVISEWKVEKLSSSALGDNEMKYVKMEGRVIIDMMKVVQRDHKLDTYKLDAVSSKFISGKMKKMELLENNTICCLIDNANGIQNNSFIHLDESEKIKVIKVNLEENTIYLENSSNINLNSKSWGLAKDDVTPKEIFACQNGSSKDRTRVAHYCLIDCALCNFLMIKLETLSNNMGMSNVCYVPLSYIFMRGQSIKIFSFVAKQCKDDNYLIPFLDKDWKCEICGIKNSSYTDFCTSCKEAKPEDEGYEGAIVLDPVPGIYVDEPIVVFDYSSLYPSSMISENISHDSIVLDKKYDNLPGYEYLDITYDIFEGKGDKKKKVGEQTSRFAQFPNGKKGILPRILDKLLQQRKNTRKKIKEVKITQTNGEIIQGLIIEKNDLSIKILCEDKTEVIIDKSDIIKQEDAYNEYEKSVLDGLQLAYKITANSLYGQVGAKTSSIFLKELAASTTATGRNLILKAKKFVENEYNAKVIYGDTDSIFCLIGIKEKYQIYDKTEMLKKAISMGNEISASYQKTLKEPHSLQYEKCLYPFIIFSKKRYVGNLYENDPNSCYRKVMGLSLKRRDFANISKIVYGGIIDIILKTNDVKESLRYFNKCIADILDGKYSLEDFIITKTLKGNYKTPDRIVHKVLADRMSSRDRGSAPQTNDRVPYVYIVKKETRGQKLLQGERVEDPLFIKENNLKIDYEFYITNQIMNSVCQLYGLIIEKLPNYNLGDLYFKNVENRLKLDEKMDLKRITTKVSTLKEKEVKKLLFDPYLNKLFIKKNNMRDITEFLQLMS